MKHHLHSAHRLQSFHNFRWHCLCLFLLHALLPIATEAATRAWVNPAGGNWHNAANWSGGVVPNSADTVLINADGTYTVTIAVDAAFESLTLGGGSGTQTLQWQAGSVTGHLTVASSGVLDFGGDFSKVFTGVLTNFGRVVWPASGPQFWFFTETRFENAVGGLVDLQRDSILTPNVGTFSFNNAGTLRKSGGTSTSSSFNNGAVVTNTGTVQVQTGTFRFPDGFTSTSTFDVSAGARIELSGGTFHFQPGHAFTGNGYYGVADGSPVINGPIINTNFMVTGGQLNITNQLTGALYWIAGNVAGELTVAAGGTLNFGGDFSKVFNGGVLTNHGTIVWPATGPQFWFFTDTRFENQPSGVVDLQRDSILTPNVGTFSFNNAGTLRKSGGTSTSSSFNNGAVVTNTGTVQVQTGTFRFPDGFTSTSTFDVSAGARIELSGGTFHFQPGHTFTGNGYYGVADGSPVINGPIINTNFMVTGGQLNITNQLTGALYWVAGNVAGELTVATNALLHFGGDNSKVFNGGVLTNHGTIVWPASGPQFWFFSDTRFENAVGGLVDLQRDSILTPNVGTFSFNNAGTLRKSGGTSTSSSFNNGAVVTNTGTVQVQTGTFRFPDGFTSTSTFDVSAGARIELSGGTFHFQPGHTFTGNGYYGVNDGSPVINGPIINTNFMVTGGQLNITNQLTGALYWVAGNVAGELTVATNALLHFGGDNSKVFNGGVLTNHGTIVWPATGPQFWFFTDTRFENQPSGVVDLQRDGVLSQNVGTFSFNNAGTLRKSGGTGTGGFNTGIAVTNSGTFEVTAGDLNFPSSYQMTSGLLRFGIGGLSTFGRITVTGSAPLAGGLGAVLLGGFVPDTNVSFPVMIFGASSGTFTETGGLRVGSGRAFTPVYGSTTLSLLSFLANDITITNQPQSTTVVAGNNAQFVVGASADEPVTYQWRFGGSPLANSNTNRYTVVNAQPGNTGNYDVVLTTASGSVTSLVATLTVHVPPSFTATPVSVTVGSGQIATFSAGASGIPSPTYQWLFNGTPIPGATGPILTVAGAGTNVGAFSVVISNAAGSVTNTVSLTLVDLKFFAGVVIDAALNSQFQVEFTTDVNTPTTNWTTLGTVVVTNRPHIIYDANSPGSVKRFYRAVPLD